MTKNKIWLFAVILTALALSLWFLPLNTVSYQSDALDPVLDEPALPPLPYGIPRGLPAKTERILIDLIKCESQGNPNALNEVDRDGTASYGLLQFKPATLHAVVTQYKILPDIEKDEILNVIYDGDLQIRAFLAYYGDGQPISWWQQQFPACSKKYNYWQ